ncbi:crossover junction endodeoxyribonuclease RuvC [Patescibacteria group bacterium]|nr:MAG: crossover junction endodeoxyribonuclease RuvC [Patescibacteria group bacterium]
MPRIILGIDPGYGRMGFGCLRVANGKTTVLDYGIVSTSADDAFGDRLVQLADDLDELIRTHKPDRLAVEKLYFTKNVKTAMQVAEARGVIMLTAARHKLPVFEMTPSQAKSALTGNGRADKKAMQWMVKEILAMKKGPKLDDAADALALAITAAAMRV